MNSITAGFDEILRFAGSYGLPMSKKRAILREYLQTKILSLLYRETISKGLFFVGGTSLRLLRGLDRFSEDLDFDAPGLSSKAVHSLFLLVRKQLNAENIPLNMYSNQTEKKYHYEFRFPSLLYELKLSLQREEKLTIKFDVEYDWRGQARETTMLNRYGLLATVVTKTTDQILIEKLAAYVSRSQTQARDVYDIVWLVSHGAKPDWGFAKKNSFTRKLLAEATDKFVAEKNKLAGLKRKLQPYLFDEKNIATIDFFPKLVGDLGTLS